MSEINNQLFTLMSRIEGMSNQFTKTDWKIVQYLKKNTAQFIESSAQELAAEIGTSDASIIRFSQKVGFSGLNELKYTMQKELNKSNSSSDHSDYTTLFSDNKALIDSLYNLTNPKDIDSLRGRMLKANRIFIIGLDFNGYVAEMIAHKFLLLGLTVQAITTQDTLKLYCTLSQSDDLFIAISLSGNHKLLASVIKDLIKNDSSVILISNYEKSLCAAFADMTLLIPKTDLLQNSNSIAREILILMLFDMIFHSFLNKDPKSSQIFHKTASYSKLNDDNTMTGFDRLKDLF